MKTKEYEIPFDETINKITIYDLETLKPTGEYGYACGWCGYGLGMFELHRLDNTKAIIECPKCKNPIGRTLRKHQVKK